MHSLWEKQSFYHSDDIVIIGAGLTGLLTSIYLKEHTPSLSVRVLEKGTYPSGASVKNAGFACFGSVSEILDDIAHEGDERAFSRLYDRYRGLQKLIALTGPASIDLKQHDGFEVFTDKEKKLQALSLQALPDINKRIAEELAFEPYDVVSNEFGFNCLDSVIRIRREASLDSGKLMLYLLKYAARAGVILNFGTELTNYQSTGNKWELQTSSGNYKGNKLIFATNGFSNKLLRDIPILPARGQLLLTDPIPDLNLKGNFHVNQGYYYFRAMGNRILLGGGRHLDRENEQTSDQNTTEIIQNSLEKLLKETIIPKKEFTINQRWAGTMAFGPSNEKDAIVKELQPGLYIGARLGGMGVAMASVVAENIVKLAV